MLYKQQWSMGFFNGHVQPPAPFLPQDVQAVHCTLRGDALWFVVKAGACDKVPYREMAGLGSPQGK